MSLVDLNVLDFINEVDSSSPAPGGGSVSALASSLGVALAKMVSHLTIGRKKFLDLDEDIQKEYLKNFNLLNTIKANLLPLIDKDTEAFNKIMEAFRMPKNTNEENLKRNDAIEMATLEAIKVPLEVAKLSLNALETIKKMYEFGNKNAISDIGVGTLLLYTGLEGAILNIKINLAGLTDQDSIGKYNKYCIDVLDDGKKIKDEILTKIHQNL